jgi:hypothetical protein
MDPHFSTSVGKKTMPHIKKKHSNLLALPLTPRLTTKRPGAKASEFAYSVVDVDQLALVHQSFSDDTIGAKQDIQHHSRLAGKI